MYERLAAFKRRHGHPKVGQRHDPILYRWVVAQRFRRRSGALCAELIQLPEEVALDFPPARPRRPSRPTPSTIHSGFEFKEGRAYWTSAVARVLEVERSVVERWVNSGELRACKTPHGQRRILGADLRAFLERNFGPSSQRTESARARS
jgi:excisionase family DNA binding protein